MADLDLRAGRPAHETAHPGALLREDLLPALRVGPAAAARAPGVSRQALHAVLSERSAVTPEMAVPLGKPCGNGPGLRLRMQQARDLRRAERDMDEAAAAVPTTRAP